MAGHVRSAIEGRSLISNRCAAAHVAYEQGFRFGLFCGVMGMLIVGVFVIAIVGA